MTSSAHDGPDARGELARAASLSEADVAAITARLARMDRSSSRGPWTGAVLALIADRPGIVSTVLAEAMGWERQDFKLHVRRLKELGLTLTLDVGPVAAGALRFDLLVRTKPRTSALHRRRLRT
jgi:hypothetical protein